VAVCGATAQGEETNEVLTAEQFFEGGTSAFNNWVEFSVGGQAIDANKAQAKQNLRLDGAAFGGIEDLRLQQTVATNTVLTIDGRALFDLRDYKLTLDLRREEVGFLRFNYQHFRTWDHGAGGYYPPTGLQYTLPNDVLTLDRGEISFEAGLAVKDVPKINFKYTHSYRDGQKTSTIWGPVHPEANAVVRALYPGYYDLDERTDSFQLDVAHQIKATEFGLGVRYDKAELDNALKTTQWQGEPVQRHVTDKQDTSYDLLSVHAFSETWIKKDLFFSSGFLFANLDNTFSGSRIYGDDFDVAYAPNPLNGLGYLDLAGDARQKEYVLNLNLMATPLKNFTLVPSLKFQKKDWDADSTGLGTLGEATTPFTSASERNLLEARQRLDLRHTGLTNWVFFGGGEWTEGSGTLEEYGGLAQVNGIGVPPVRRETDDTRFFQKYFLGAKWYPARRVSLSLGGYYKDKEYDYEHEFDGTPNGAASGNRYPAYLTMQGFQTYDGHVGLTLRPLNKVSLVTRYEYQWSTVEVQPDSLSGLSEIETAEIPSHIIAQNIGWTPLARLSLQAGFNYVLSETRTPASDYTQAILTALNNYWTLNFSSTVVLDDKTDLRLGYFYYCADNYEDNSLYGVPLGAGAEQQSVTATLTRRLTERIRLNLKYGFTHYTDWASGGNNDFDAHLVYASMQYRF
jgi:hypothetical protein